MDTLMLAIPTFPIEVFSSHATKVWPHHLSLGSIGKRHERPAIALIALITWIGMTESHMLVSA